MVEWASNVNKIIRRSSTSWNMISAVLEDTTKSGKTKRRLSASQEKRTFNVRMLFSLTEYNLFKTWYEETCIYGVNSFGFPQIDTTNGDEKEYRFKAGQSPSFSNVSGDVIECSMVWEEV